MTEYVAMVQGQLQALRDEIAEVRRRLNEQGTTIRGLCGQIVDLLERHQEDAASEWLRAHGNGGKP